MATSGPVAFLTAVMLAGCGGGSGQAAPGPGQGGTPRTTLLSDDFSGQLTAKWTIIGGAGSVFPSSTTSGDADTLGSPPHGNPSPGLWMKGASNGATLGAVGGVQSISSYPTSKGLSVTFDARRDSGIDVSGGNGLLFLMTDISGGQPKALLKVDSTSVTYLLTIHDPASGDHPQEVTHSFSPDTIFHLYTLAIDAVGNASWSRDGALQQVVAGFPLNKNLSLKATSPSSNDQALGSAHIDNVLVTTP